MFSNVKILEYEYAAPFKYLNLKNKLKAINTATFITNQLCRVIYQFSSNLPIPPINIPESSTVEQRLD